MMYSKGIANLCKLAIFVKWERRNDGDCIAIV